MADSTNRSLDDLVETLADIEIALNGYDYREAKRKVRAVNSREQDLLGSPPAGLRGIVLLTLD